jgi:FMN phosphatase YigB (HAD superfamily)
LRQPTALRERPRAAEGPWAAVLFDLDGTLLELDGEGFLDRYVDALVAWWGPEDAEAFRHAVMAASVPIFRPHAGLTNGEVFRRHLGAHLGLEPAEVAARMAAFHREVLDRLLPPAAPVPGAREAVARCLALGLRVAVATTPIYTPDVIALRLRWAGVADLPWHLVTHSEVMHTCKPDAAYFAEAARLLGVPPEACLMVGDDPLQDGPAARAGMAVLLRDERPGWRTLDEVVAVVAGEGDRP